MSRRSFATSSTRCTSSSFSGSSTTTARRWRSTTTSMRKPSSCPEPTDSVRSGPQPGDVVSEHPVAGADPELEQGRRQVRIHVKDLLRRHLLPDETEDEPQLVAR